MSGFTKCANCHRNTAKLNSQYCTVCEDRLEAAAKKVEETKQFYERIEKLETEVERLKKIIDINLTFHTILPI